MGKLITTIFVCVVGYYCPPLGLLLMFLLFD